MYITMGDLGKTYDDDEKKILDGDVGGIEDDDIVVDDDQMESDAESMDSDEDDDVSINSDDASQTGNSDADNRRCGLLRAKAERLRNLCHRATRRFNFDLNRAVGKIRLPQKATNAEGIGYRGARSALAVTRRPRAGAGTLWPYLENTLGIDPGDRAAAFANGCH